MTGTIQQAAAEIVALINSRPNTPGKAEIAAVIGRIGAGAPAPISPALAELYREWRGLIEENVRKFGGSDEGLTDAEIEAEEERLAAHMDLIADPSRRILEPRCARGAMSWPTLGSASGVTGLASTRKARTRKPRCKPAP